MFHVEHSMKLMIGLFFLILFTIVGCRKPLPDPQASDYIYLNIKQELAAAEAKLLEKQGQLNELKSKMPETDIQTSNIKMLRAKIDFAASDIRKLEQRVKYWKIKLLSREELVRRKYLAAFNKGEEWDNTAETENFKKSQQRFRPRSPSSASAPKKQSEAPPSEASGEE